MKNKGRRITSLILAGIMLISLLPSVYAEPASDDGTQTDDYAPTGKFTVSTTNYTIAEGITESHIIYNTAEGNDQVKGYLTSVSPDAKAEFKASYSNYYSKNSTVESRAKKAESLLWNMVSTTKQAANFEMATGRNVLVATNGDYYNMQTGQPNGYLIMEGNVVQTSNGTAQEPYFAVLDDGSYAIREYGTDCSDVKEAISGPFLLVKNGEIVYSADDTTKAPRNSIGLKEDGTVLMFLADGRQGVSNGMTVNEVAQIMKNAGCVNAIYLDGGGSATLASKHEGSSTLELQNTPSDGMERVVASSLMLVSTAEGSGRFDHASLSPNNEVYIAGGTVEFTAVGVDTAGYPVDIPEGVKWSITDSSYGSIDATTGVFKSNGKCGTVTAELVYNGKSVGSTSVEVQEPDTLEFASESLNLRFNSTSDLGLSVRYKNRDVNLSGVDLDWTITPNGDFKADEIGTISNNQLTTFKADEARKATVTVSYTKSDADKTVLSDSISIEIGKMPQVIWDFEPDENGNVSKGVAQYDWGKAAASPEGYTPDTNPLTYLAWDDEADAPGMITKEGPMFFDGTYIDPNPEVRDICYYPAASIFSADGYDFFTNHTGVMQNFSASGAIVNSSNGQVRFGDYALRWDYNYENLAGDYKNVNMWLYSTETVELEGTPTGFGFWVYAPEGTANFWLWVVVGYYDENGDEQREWIHLKTQEGRSLQYNGIYWEGWMYVEADLSSLAKYVTPERPLHFSQGQYFLNLTFIPGGSANENGDKIPMGSFSKGSLYFDNFRVVYGDTVDDMDSPEFKNGVRANGTELAEDGSTVITSSTITISAAFSDPEGDNATGITTEKTALYVDGIKQSLTTSTATEAATKLMLANGTHSVKFVISDGFGNVTNITRYFTVNDPNSPYGTVKLSGESTAAVGREYSLTLTTDDYAKLGNVNVSVALNDAFGEPVVTFSDGYTGTSEYADGVLTVSASADSPKSGDIAKITFNVPASLAKGSQLNYEVTTATYTNGSTTLSFAQAKAAVGVTAEYDLTASVMTAGGKGTITVANSDDGSAAKRVSVYLVSEDAEDELIGKTNSSGTLITNRLCRTAGEAFVIYAMDADGNRSFYYAGTTYGRGSDEVIPTNVRLNAVEDPATTQSISWFSSPEYTEAKAVVQYVDKATYDSGTYTFASASGDCSTYSFVDDNSSSQINSVTISGLKPATTYYYRVGDGVNGHWSEISQFTTSKNDADTSFFVIGDTQLSGNTEADAEDIATMNKIAENIQAVGVNFGIQTGDFVDKASSLGAWNEILDIFGDNYGSLPIVQVMGNHEYYGDTSGNTAEAVFDIPGEDYYSVEYGNVYVAVINCNASLEAAAKWLVADAAKSDCEWKVLTVHQPPYYTNVNGSSAAYNEYLPSAIDEAGIDFVFSGHDHSYARTEPLTGGAVDKEDGAVYFISGDLGEKSRSTEYAAENNPDFHFAVIDQEYDAVYFIASTEDNVMTVTAYNADGSVIDSYTMKHLDTCDKNGHSFVYNNGKLSCSVCGDNASSTYSGAATDSKTGKQMYFVGGKYQTGWFVLDSDIYHFDSNGLAHKVTVKEDIKTDCKSQGHKTVKCECGATYTLAYGKPVGHNYVEMTKEDGTVCYRCSNCGDISTIGLPFTDVTDKDWYAKELSFCYHNGYINGTSRTTFSPNQNITREQLATIIWRLEGEPVPTSSDNPFTDKASTYAQRAVCWAAENGIINGYDDKTFRPSNNCSRQEMVTIFYRYAQYKAADTTARTDLNASFTDASSISSYAKDAVSWATAEKIINGITDANGKVIFQPAGTATRAQVAAVISRLVNATTK
jgi:hypothetical protein